MDANGCERQFVYVYGAASPIEGELDWMIGRVMNTEQMRAFLAQVSAAHPHDFMRMVVDGASSHIAKALQTPENIRSLRLPPRAPELNPKEHVWDKPNTTINAILPDAHSGTKSGRMSFPIASSPVLSVSCVSWRKGYRTWRQRQEPPHPDHVAVDN